MDKFLLSNFYSSLQGFKNLINIIKVEFDFKIILY